LNASTETKEVKSESKITKQRRAINLSVKHNVATFEVLPREIQTYSKGTQTAFDEGEYVQQSREEKVKEVVHAETSSQKPQSDEKEADSKSDAQSQVAGEAAFIDKEAVASSQDFLSFLDRSSRIVERALYISSEYDIDRDYGFSDAAADKSSSKREVTQQIKLFDERWSKHRSVTDVSWSPQFQDLVLASYSASENNSNDPDGVVLVWSAQNTLQRPEYRFHCQSPVMTSFFSKFSPTIIIGGTYSGQIVLWDVRAKSTPVQHTPLSSIGHTHPVYSMSVVGTKNANSLVSVSTDGKLCVWSLENLLQPQEVLELHSKQGKSTTIAAPVAVTCMAFRESEVNCFSVGSEEGSVYQAYRHGSQRGVSDRFDGHFGPVTGVDFHPSTGAIDFSDLFLTSSTDWTCKLWNQKSSTKSLYSFNDAGDYIYDVKWSPTHPALFASVDGSGMLDLWNLNEETEVPITKTAVGTRALNRLQWSNDGKKILTGDSLGALYIYDTGEISVPHADEWTKFEETLQKLRTQDDAATQNP